MKFSDIVDPITGDRSRISSLALGCSQLGSFGAQTPLRETRETLARALDLGVNLFDTADIYGQGDSERELGRLLKGRRDAGFVVTKLGKGFSLKMKVLRPLKPILKPILRATGGGSAATSRREDHMREDFSPGTFAARVDGSLRRLGFDYLDALLLHSPPAEALIASVAAALADLKAAGKVRHFGVSCDDEACLKASLAMPGLSLLQLPLALHRATIGGPLGQKILSRNVAVLVREVVRSQPHVSPSEAVRLAASVQAVSSVIVGTSKKNHLEELVNTF